MCVGVFSSTTDYPIPGFASWDDYNRALRAYKEAEASREAEEQGKHDQLDGLA